MSIDLPQLTVDLLSRAPEVPSLFVADAADLPEIVVPTCGDCLGFAFTPALADTVLKKHIAGYDGGPIIGLKIKEITAQAEDGHADRLTLAIANHELAHHLPYRPPYDTEPSTPAIAALEFKSLTKSREIQRFEDESADPWHDWRFYRRVAHIHIRSILAGFDAGAHAGGTEHVA